MGARGGSVIYTNKHAPAQHSTEQGRLREDSAGPVHAERPPVGQRTAPAHTTGLEDQECRAHGEEEEDAVTAGSRRGKQELQKARVRVYLLSKLEAKQVLAEGAW
ncbi:hypothetical protein NDU88_005413 [Pleurodeles waltl]|uniref:Uncharacterized protein n=1 Tax=Pleurodeles waltl TaxID=8319 RepID=A0AAV7LML0_PLEWA|nr:hypothetical protein NDU88_005413 [Pleurodeles waltl]